MKEEKKHLIATKEGKLRVSASNLFTQEKVQSMILSMANSSIFKEIKDNQKAYS